jgi:hypothetical protein
METQLFGMSQMAEYSPPASFTGHKPGKIRRTLLSQRFPKLYCALTFITLWLYRTKQDCV